MRAAYRLFTVLPGEVGARIRGLNRGRASRSWTSLALQSVISSFVIDSRPPARRQDGEDRLRDGAPSTVRVQGEDREERVEAATGRSPGYPYAALNANLATGITVDLSLDDVARLRDGLSAFARAGRLPAAFLVAPRQERVHLVSSAGGYRLLTTPREGISFVDVQVSYRPWSGSTSERCAARASFSSQRRPADLAEVRNVRLLQPVPGPGFGPQVGGCDQESVEVRRP